MARTRWFGRSTVDGDTTGALDPETLEQLRSHHLLLVPSTVGVDEVSWLVRAKVPRGDLARDGEISLGRHSRLIGPFELAMEEAVDAAVPMPWTVAYALESPVEREDPPLPGLDDRDGFAFAFPRGLPWREEGRGIHLLVSLARRVHGAVRVGGGELIQPDPERAVDYIVRSPYWLEPDMLRGVVSRELPNTRIAVEGADWTGPHSDLYSGLAIREETADDPLTPGELEYLHARADAYDMAVLAGDEAIDSFAVIGPIGNGEAGLIEVRVHVASAPEPSVLQEDWSDGPYVVYEVRWSCPDPQLREQRLPTPKFLDWRARAVPVVQAVTRILVEATSGMVTDEDGFWVDRYLI
ncbi:MAG: hypothetical protein P8Z68_02920 [Kineosporiaceae bacterium]